MPFLLNEAPQSTSKQKAKEKLKKSFKNFKKTLEKQLTQKVSCSRISRLLKRQRKKLENRIVRTRIETQSILRILASG